ncbi:MULTISPECIES: response regulator [Leptolyngbya]|jgi:DNA-binding NarL/FixJ family response regulator|uniref:LuxR family two component transcriptional regulator n=2 Tax=Leptolyngbya boryana TaxID=1184 RepID=A0A1Z4JFW9_LEPBY|nr:MULTISPECIES: response regulator transcription factor [Leptolyngbya]BAY55675.1 LuxR family two component transcriptional regulator [Leptolyngbya boryana NIES-2135]MBD2371543.1 response regulator transcription factor [Leptolyngbya sp. FACHB-161]MBD2378082.1 response regulator transcription factor [Leptolyngbya sp. FACHB-238]MBD2402486.1 response regulator transcription factor [Leptolyngbya sp. FACHB-239]MBD2408973.1 response regulator transcription factor [Leptolyngbya sp. FACHB-402]
MPSIRVVLVEDHDLTRFGVRAMLREHGNIELVGEARDAKSGLKVIQETHPDVAIVDIGLPDMNGVELTQQLRAMQAEAGVSPTKVLIMTMQDDQEVVLAAFAAGADSYCMKDISGDRLSEAVALTAEGHGWIDPAIAKIVLKQVQTNSPTSAPASTVTINRLSEEESQSISTYPITARELDVLTLIVDGRSNAEIAERLYITVGTVKTHVRNILNKLCVSDRTQIAVRALRAGLVQ